MNLLPMRLILIFTVSLILTILPLPGLLSYFKPTWELLFLLYMQFYLPHYFHVLLLFFIGLLLDALLATVIGEHAFALILVGWIASTKSRRFYFFSISQQMALIGLLTFTYQAAILLIDGFLGFSIYPWSLLTNTVVNILLWPWIRLLGDEALSTAS